MPTRTLPEQPSLAQLKRQARELFDLRQKGDSAAESRIAAHHPSPPADFKLADAQLTLAREYGYDHWAALKHFVEIGERVAAFSPHPQFEAAVVAMDAGDVDRLRGLLAAHPDLVRARTNLEAPYHYFTGATLLHHIAGNPDRGRFSGERGPLPRNSAEVARLLLESGADVHATTLGPNGGTTMGLLLTSQQASLADVSGPLIDVLLEYGENLDLGRPDVLDGSLINHAPRAAEHLIALGAKPDLFAASALGRMDLLPGFFDAEGRLRKRQRRLSARDAIGLAMLVAYVRGQSATVDFLLERDGNWNMIGVNNGTALHRAASEGDLEMVKRLIAKGADFGDRNNPFVATPLSWADHLGRPEVVAWFRANCPIDLHDAVCFDFPEHVEARLRENPSSVDERRCQWQLPDATPLHCAALMNRPTLAQVLLDHGADPSLRAGNGQTALEIAEEKGAEETLAVLRVRSK